MLIHLTHQAIRLALWSIGFGVGLWIGIVVTLLIGGCFDTATHNMLQAANDFDCCKPDDHDSHRA